MLSFISLLLCICKYTRWLKSLFMLLPADSISVSMYATLDLWLSSLRSLPGEMDETDALRSKRCNEDAISLAPSTTETIFVEGELTWVWD